MNYAQDNNMGFTAAQAAEIIGATQRAIIDWGNRGLVQPGVKGSTGQGDRRIYSVDNLVQFAVLRELFDAGLLREQVMTLMKHWKALAKTRESFARWFRLDPAHPAGAEWLLVVDGKQWFMKWDGSGFLRTGQEGVLLPEEKEIPHARKVIAINLTTIKQEIVEKLH